MSHTDKTRPIWVQFHDPYNRRYMEEIHNHIDGVCDLDEWLQKPVDWVPYRYRDRHCYLYHPYYGAWHKEFRERHNYWGEPQPRRARAAWVQERNKMLKDRNYDQYTVPRNRELNTWRRSSWYD